MVVGLTMETYIARSLVLAFSFASSILLARLLGPEGKGYIATSLFWSGVATITLMFGMDSAAIYFVGESPGRYHKVARFFLTYAFVATMVGAGVFQCLEHFAGLFQDQPLLLWGASGLILTTMLTASYDALYIGIGKLSFTNRVAVAGAALYSLLLVGLSWVPEVNVGVVLIGILGIRLLTSFFMVIRTFVMPRQEEIAPFRWADFGKYSAKVYLGNLAGFLYLRSSFMILSLSAPIGEVGIYSIAHIFADLILILPTALINIVLPKVAAMSREQTIRQVSETTRLSLAAALVMALGVSLAATFLVPLAFGPAFEPAVGMIWILCTGAWVAVGGMVLSIYFNGIKRPGVPASAAWIGSAAVALLTLLLTPRWGGYGAAIALSLSRLIVTVYLLAIYLRDSRERLAVVLLIRPIDWQQGIRFVRSIWS
jgi:O-antigen/teichoic acid export membrane protein